MFTDDYNTSNNAFNRFVNLDSIEDRIIYYLISDKGKSEEQLKHIHTIWRLLKYNDIDCLIDTKHTLPKLKEIAKFIDNGTVEQSDKKIFRYAFIEDVFTDQTAMIRVYIDSITPTNHLISVVNIGIDLLIHNKISNVTNPLHDNTGDLYNLTEENLEIGLSIGMKNRATVLLKSVLALLNGADIAGVGALQFNQNLNRFNQSRLGLWNNRNYYGHKLIISCQMSGVS